MSHKPWKIEWSIAFSHNVSDEFGWYQTRLEAEQEARRVAKDTGSSVEVIRILRYSDVREQATVITADGDEESVYLEEPGVETLS